MLIYMPSHADMIAAHQTRYRDGMLRAWMRRTKQGNSYRPENVPPYITVPTNEQRSAAERVRFVLDPLPYGQSYSGYLYYDGARDLYRICTWTGDTLATVTSIKRRRVRSWSTSERGSFWARGIDGRLYYGTHNGAGMHCRMRLAKKQ